MPSYKASLVNDPLGRVISLNDIDVGAMPFAIAALVVIALLVALFLVALAGVFGGCSVTAPGWEYRIESIRDADWQNTMTALGDRGWELATARRAVRGEGESSEGLYECIFKRPKALFRTSLSQVNKAH